MSDGCEDRSASYTIHLAGRCVIVTSSLAAQSLRPLLEECGYRRRLLLEGYPLGTTRGTQTVPLMAFAHEPPDAGSACIAVVDSEEDPTATVAGCRQLGAPVVFAVHRGDLQWWSQGAERPCHLQTLKPEEIRPFFAEHRGDLAPEAIYRAKTRGRFEAGYQLAFVDAGLMPWLEEEMSEKLGHLVERAVITARDGLAPGPMTSQRAQWLLQSVFWLLAAKILQDKEVPGFAELDLTAVSQVLSRVAKHYGAQNREFALRSKKRRDALAAAAGIIARFASLSHVTPESLASVYEASLVDKDTRKKLGIHSTPSFLARYVVWRLAPWIEEISRDERHVFEPTCGQGAFLVAAMRVLRDLLPNDVSRKSRKAYLRQHLHGIDIDSFAIELARLSLTLADVPNPDGWDLSCTDVFTAPDLEERASQAKIFLANPPFESFDAAERERLSRQGVDVQAGSRAAELLRRTLPHLPPGAVFGVVVPQGLLHARGAADVRSMLVEAFEIAEITLLPDKIFTYSDAESALLLGRKLKRNERSGSQVRHLRVREPDVGRFRASYDVSVERRVSQIRFAQAPGNSFAVPELEEVWEACRGLPRLEELAEVGKGLEYLSDLSGGTVALSATKFPGARRGFARLGRKLQIHEQPREVWMNLDSEVIRRRGSGVDSGIPQVLVNHARSRRGPWCLKGTLDPKGHPVTGNFLTVRPKRSQVLVSYLWAILNSPLASAYCSSHSTKRHILKKTLRFLPVPHASSQDVQRVSQAAEVYLQTVRGEERELLTAEPDPSRARELLLALDAEVLRLYDLPPRLERQVLDLFAGWPRPGVPFHFDRYFPAGFEPWIPLHLYLSQDYQRSTAGQLRRGEGPVPDAVVDALAAAADAFEE